MRKGHCRRLRGLDGRESNRGRAKFAQSVNRATRRRRSISPITKHAQKTERLSQAVHVGEWWDDVDQVLNTPDLRMDEAISTFELRFDNNNCPAERFTIISNKSCASRWDEAVIRANVAAKEYRVKIQQQTVGKQQTQPLPKENKESNARTMTTKRQNNARATPKEKRNCNVKKKLLSFDSVKELFWLKYGSAIRCHLENVYQDCVCISDAPISSAVQQRFCSLYNDRSIEKATLLPAFHGTNVANHASIFRRGLLIPGHGSDIPVAHGNVYGVGIYATKLGYANWSLSYCIGDRSMLVCGVLDCVKPDGTRPIQHHNNGSGGFMVICDAQCVVPLYKAYVMANVTGRVDATVKMAGSCSARPQRNHDSVVAYVTRRAARKRWQ